MSPQELAAALLRVTEQEGRHLLRSYVAALDQSGLKLLVDLLKREADQQWRANPDTSFMLAGYLMAIGDWSGQKSYHALGLMARGDALRRMDRDEDALPFLDAAGEEYLSLNDEIGWARTRIGRVSACLQLNRPTEALEDAAKAREIFIRHGKFLRAGQIDVNAAMVNFELGQYDKALRLFDRAIESYERERGNLDLYIARAGGNKAVTLTAMGKFREAITIHEQARATFARYPGQEIDVAREELNIARIYANQGHYSQALLLYNRSRAAFQQQNMLFEAAEVAQQMCLCLVRLNRAQEAYNLAAQTVTFFRASPDRRRNLSSQGYRHNLAYSLLQQAEAAMQLENYREADEMLREASDLLEEGGFMVLASSVRLQQAELDYAQGNLEASKRKARHVADAFAELEALPQLARAALLQARIGAASEEYMAAQDLCQQARDIAQGQELLDLLYQCDAFLGQLAEQSGNLEEATLRYDLAVRGIDEVQSRLIMDDRTSFLEDKGAIYQRAVLLALRRGYVDQALIYVEKAKSRVLSDYLRNNIDIRLHAEDLAGETLVTELSQLREEQAWYSSIVFEAEHEANLSDTAIMRRRAIGPAEAKQAMQEREQRIGHLLEQVQLHLAEDLISRQQSHWTTGVISTLRPKLAKTSLMLEYYLAGTDLYIFQVTRGGIAVHTVPGAAPKLERLYSLWHANLDLAAQAAGTAEPAQSFDGLQENALGLLHRLYDLLFKPVARALAESEHVIIVPYGILHYLPFHCLYDGTQFTIERSNISYLPSATSLDICRQRGQRLAVGRIPFNHSLVLGQTDHGRLPYAAREAESVARILGTRPWLDQGATSALLRQAGARSPVVHIAAHGQFRLDAPNFSHIKLADGPMSTIDVFNLDLSSCSLVTLSACETGRAVVGGVDEVIGLGRGFLYAGAASLLPTLWKVDDASSAELMEMFYQALLGEYSKAEALAGAQRAFLARARASKQPYRIHPYYWAAFHLIGDFGALM